MRQKICAAMDVLGGIAVTGFILLGLTWLMLVVWDGEGAVLMGRLAITFFVATVICVCVYFAAEEKKPEVQAGADHRSGRVLSSSTEFFMGGIRVDPGRYLMIPLDPDPEPPQF